MLLKRIDVPTGEIAVYQDGDGYHAELWDEAKQMVTAQSGDCETEGEAITAVAERLN